MNDQTDITQRVPRVVKRLARGPDREIDRWTIKLSHRHRDLLSTPRQLLRIPPTLHSRLDLHHTRQIHARPRQINPIPAHNAPIQPIDVPTRTLRETQRATGGDPRSTDPATAAKHDNHDNVTTVLRRDVRQHRRIQRRVDRPHTRFDH